MTGTVSGAAAYCRGSNSVVTESGSEKRRTAGGRPVQNLMRSDPQAGLADPGWKITIPRSGIPLKPRPLPRRTARMPRPDTDCQAKTESARADRPRIELRGVSVHNLRQVDVDIPLNALTVISGVSGSGKSSLAFDTLYAEGQRRYIESFSVAARMQLERLEKPDAERIDHIPPAVALRQNSISRSSMATLATMTEIDDLLRLLFARLGTLICPDCGCRVQVSTSGSLTELLLTWPEGMRFQIAFAVSSEFEHWRDAAARLAQAGFSRAAVVTGATAENATLSELSIGPEITSGSSLLVIVDRLSSGRLNPERLTESLEAALRGGEGRCLILHELSTKNPEDAQESAESDGTVPKHILTLDGRNWLVERFSERLECGGCGRAFDPPEPELLSFRSARGACRGCSGRGLIPDIAFDHLVPDPTRSLADGALACLAEPAVARERERFLKQAAACRIPVDVPFATLSAKQREQLRHGTGDEQWSGLRGLLQRLSTQQQRPHIRRFLHRWSPLTTCPDCRGSRLNALAQAVRLVCDKDFAGETCRAQPGLQRQAAGNDDSWAARRAMPAGSIADLSALSAAELMTSLDGLADGWNESQRETARYLQWELKARLKSLIDLGLGDLPLNRSLATLSRGEVQRAALAALPGSRLVNTLFVIDEPSTGLHPRDSRPVLDLLKQLRDSGNTVVVVEHERDYLLAADWIVDVGPGAGQDGGTIQYSGSVDGFRPTHCPASLTAAWLHPDEAVPVDPGTPAGRTSRAALRLTGCRHRNLQNVDVEIPLGVLCVVTGVSGAGKSALVEETLYPALCAELQLECDLESPGPFDSLTGASYLRSVQRVDDSPLAGSLRSSPVTWLKAFDEIRRLFADTHEARSRNLTAGHFSFNTASDGRCPHCEGRGLVDIDMQFLADVRMTCPECHGTRYQRHILEVHWRGRSIADVLAMTTAEAFAFFRGEPRIQKRLRALKEVGLDYLTLGQPLSTLSGGEAQRLKLAACLSSTVRSGSLIILNEPTAGLHPADVRRLLSCFDSLLAVGHSLLVIEHQLDVIRAADHIIDIGPGAGSAGGRIVACGSLETIRSCPDSATGPFL